MGWSDWLEKSKKTELKRLHSSEDFRGKKGIAGRGPDGEPSLPPLTAPVALPLLGAVRAHYLILALCFVLYLPLRNSPFGIVFGLLGGLTLLFTVLWEFYLGMQGKLDEWKETLVAVAFSLLAWALLGWMNGIPDFLRLLVPSLGCLGLIALIEQKRGEKSEGMLNELRESVYAILLAIFVWYGAGFLLNTPTPINAIVSCSMLPSYERGDMVILQGGPAHTTYVQYDGPSSDINSSARAYKKAGIDGIEQDSSLTPFAINGSILTYCFPLDGTKPECNAFVQNPSAFVESHGPLQIRYGYCKKKHYDLAKADLTTICAIGASLDGKELPFNSQNELIVYTPKAGDLYSRVGDIVHRAAFALNASDGTVYFTKGDNNQLYDFQAYQMYSPYFGAQPYLGIGNSPIRPEQIKGRVVFRLPYIGNLKLFISPQVVIDPSAMAGCDSYFEKR